MLLSNVRHQTAAHQRIQQAIESDRLPHAYVFHGPDGVGKETFAQGLAQLLLCGQPVEVSLTDALASNFSTAQEQWHTDAPTMRMGCGKCDDCRAVVSGAHPDFHVVYRQLAREHPDPTIRKRKAFDLSVDVLRHFLIERVALTPVRGRAKVFVVCEADRMTVQAQNALLKTLEEPPGATYLILMTTSFDRLLPTTRSRVQAIRFNPLPQAFVREKLTELRSNLAVDRIEWYVKWSEGSPGKALQSISDNLYEVNQRVAVGLARLGFAIGHTRRTNGSTDAIDSVELAKLWLEEAKSLGEAYKKRDAEMTDTELSRVALQTLFDLVAGWFADVLRYHSGVCSVEACGELGAYEGILNASLTSKQNKGSSTGSQQCIEAIERITQARRQLDLNANTQLCVETLANALTASIHPEPIA